MQMFDMELARKMAGDGDKSIADLLYDSMVKTLGATQGESSASGQLVRPGAPEPASFRIERQPDDKQLEQERSLPLQQSSGRTTPETSRTAANQDDHILSRFGDVIEEAAELTSLDSSLIYAVIRAESNGDPHAVSPKGARGLMQLADSTSKDYGVQRVFDPRQNVIGGSRYLKDLLDRYEGDLKLALAAYNAGPGNVARYEGVPPFDETQSYVERVTRYVASFQSDRQVNSSKAGIANTR
jgi:soluble lytic murein transglycosylase-like protein